MLLHIPPTCSSRSTENVKESDVTTFLTVAVAIETLWLLTIYGHRFFDWWDEVQFRADQRM